MSKTSNMLKHVQISLYGTINIEYFFKEFKLLIQNPKCQNTKIQGMPLYEGRYNKISITYILEELHSFILSSLFLDFKIWWWSRIFVHYGVLGD